MLNIKIKIRCVLKAESCSYLMVKPRGLQNFGVFCPFLVRYLVISLFYREYFIVGWGNFIVALFC